MRLPARADNPLALTLSVLVFAAGWSGGCSRGPAAPSKASGLPSVPVTLAIATNVPLRLRLEGHVSPFATVAVRSQVDGMVQSMHFREGDLLEPGDLMFTIDPRPFEASLNEAKANLDRDQALEKNAEMEQRLNATLLQSRIASQENYAQSAATADSLKSAVVSDNAIVEAAQLQLSYCYIRCPIGGRAGLVQVNPGNVINSQEMVLVTVNQTQPIYVDLALPERDLARVRRCMKLDRSAVEVEIPGGSDCLLKGKLAALDNSVDTNTGTILLRCLFQNQQELLWPGQAVQAGISLGTSTNAVVVPATAVQNGPPGHWVFVVSINQTLEKRMVDLEEQSASSAVLLGGVRPGERVVAKSQEGLKAGLQVSLQSAASSPNP